MGRPRILIVDDEGPVLRACVRALEEIPGAEVVPRKNGVEAARSLRSENLDLLISDIRMPGLNGLDLLEIAHELDPDLPVILMTGFGPPETQKGSTALGAAAVMVKPVHPDALIATVKDVLERFGTSAGLERRRRLLTSDSHER